MSFKSNIASYIGFFLVAISALLLCLINIFMGISFLVFTILIMVWYIRTKKRGDVYLKEVAKLTGCRFESGGTGYGCVVGLYKGRKLEVKVNNDYDSLRGISGFTLSYLTLDSAIGVLAGIKSFTSVKLQHRASVKKPYKLDERTIVDKNLILYLPPCSNITGLPTIDPKKLVAKIDDISREAEKIEFPPPPPS